MSNRLQFTDLLKDLDEDVEPTHRLSGIEVDEISPVASAANKRKFLLIKQRSGGMPNADGQDPSKGSGDTKTPAISMAGVVKKAALQPIAAGFERLLAVAKAVKIATVVEEHADVPETVIKSIGAVSTLLKGMQEGKEIELDAIELPALSLTLDAQKNLLAVCVKAADRLAKFAEMVRDAEETEVKEGETPSLPDSVIKGAGEVLELVEDITKAMSKAAPDVVPEAPAPAPAPEPTKTEKAGAKMNAQRLERFQKGMDFLASSITELTSVLDELISEGDIEKAKGKNPFADSKAPPFGKKPKDEEKKKATKKSADQEDSSAVLAALAKLTAQQSELIKVNKAQQGQIAQLQKARGMSNAIPVEGADDAAPEVDQTSWPMDLNRTIDVQDRIKKSTYFGD